jgi:hypothetical protein
MEEDKVIIEVSEKDMLLINSLLVNPPKPTEKLKQAINQYQEFKEKEYTMNFKDGLLVGVGVAVGMAGVNIGLNLLFSLIARVFG